MPTQRAPSPNPQQPNSAATENTIIRQTPHWQKLLAQAVTQPQALLQQLSLDEYLPRLSTSAQAQFPLRVPQGFIARMQPGDINDPLLRQVLPLIDEEHIAPGYSNDPLEEADTILAPGLLHKYHGRALLSVTPACAIHCRYCFRRHFPYREIGTGSEHWQAALDYIKNHPDIDEILLSGGDPLSLSDNKLRTLLNAISEIPSIKRIRLHTRLPVVLPERITPELLAMLAEHAQQRRIVIVIHANHPNEIDNQVKRALQALIRSSCTLLNQSVLLKGVNDNANALIKLSHQLLDSGTLPYYLHLLDPVNGAAHFEVPLATAKQLHKAMQSALPGYGVPRLSRETPGETSKTLIDVK